MNTYKRIVREIQAKLGIEVKLEQMKLSDGVTIVEADEFAPEFEIFVVTEDEQKIALPIGEYELEDGRIIVVEVEGIIAQVKEKQEEQEEEVQEEVVEEGGEMAQDQAPQPKSVIETQSSIKEYKFSQEDIDAKDEKIAELEAKILELSKVEEVSEEVELSEEPKPISFNPENVNEMAYELSDNATMSRRDIILNNIYNNKK